MAEPRDDGYQVSTATAILLTALSVFLAYIGLHFAAANIASEWGILGFLFEPLAVFDAFVTRLFTSPFGFSLNFDTVLIALVFFLLPWTVYYLMFARARRAYMFNKEHGTARWGTDAESARFADREDEFNNLIFSASDRMALVKKKFDLKTDRNLNVLVCGGPGSGKTRYVIKPTMMQLNASFVITDPKGTLVPETGMLFAGGDGRPVPEDCLFTVRKDLVECRRMANGEIKKTPVASAGDKIPYTVKILNLKDFNQSMRYNPFAYMRKGSDILKLATVFIKNTQGKKSNGGDEFWVKAETLFYTAIFAYMLEELPMSERTISSALDLIAAAQVKESDEDYKSPLECIFDEIETGMVLNMETGEYEQARTPNPKSLAVRSFKSFKKAAGETMKSILISCEARLAPFNGDDLRELMDTDELELDRLGDRPTAFYVCLPDTDSTYNFLAAMCFYQMFDLLVSRADNDYLGPLPIPVHCLLDEFANLGCIPDFDMLITTLRSRNISVEIVLQNFGQLDRDYEAAARIIKGGCDTTIYLGKSDFETCKEISERLGERTIANYSVTTNQGPQRSWSDSDQIMGRSLLKPDEVDRLDGEDCLVMITGARPRYSKKYDINDHPRYKYIDPGAPGHTSAVYKDPFNATMFIAAERKRRRDEQLAAAHRKPGASTAPRRIVFESKAVAKARFADDYVA